MTVSHSLQSLFREAFDVAVQACDPESAVSASISVDADGLKVGGTLFDGAVPENIVLVAIGKAACAMARGASSVLGPVRGIAVSNHSEPCPVPLLVGAHPVPSSTSLEAGEAVLDFARNVAPDDVVVYLLSGGGSSIAVAPATGVSLDALASLNKLLLRSGMPVDEMNEIRSAVSRIKGGRLSRACPATRSITLVLDDVGGTGPAHVSSGPSLGSGMGAKSGEIMRNYGLESLAPESVMRAIDSQDVVEMQEGLFYTVGSSVVAAQAAAAFLIGKGVDARLISKPLSGEARTAAAGMVTSSPAGVVLVASGETTVTVVGTGAGGRNQEAALAAAIQIEGTSAVFAAFGTDGIDGETSAAGAVVDGDTAVKARALGLGLESALKNNDSHTALSALGAVVTTGDTGTNVGDLWMVGDSGI